MTKPVRLDKPVIDVIDVSKRFQTEAAADVNVLDHINLSIRENEFVVLLGRSGCGKTTLLNVIAGLTAVSAGEVRVNGERVTGPGKGKGMVFQQNALFPWLTARRNIAFAASNRGLARKAADDLAGDLL